MNTRGNILRELLNHIKDLESNICPNDIKWSFSDCEKFICLNNQFYILTEFPTFSATLISRNIKEILGIDPINLPSKSFFDLIHPNDLPIILFADSKLINSICDNYDEIKPYDSVFTTDFRLKSHNGQYNRFLNQNCIIDKEKSQIRFKILSLYTDITHIKKTTKIEFDHSHDGNTLSFDFPDKELISRSSIFTPKEIIILKLLATGKNSREIAAMLNISHHTIDTHRRQMLAKSHQNNTAMLVAYAIENGLIST